MISSIDDIAKSYQNWYMDNLSYREQLLTLTLSTKIDEDKVVDYLISFNDVQYFALYDECDHFNDYHKYRDSGIVGVYSQSSLLDYVGHKTLVMDTRPNWGLKHYSVMTGMDFIHVITHKEPVVVRLS